MHHVDQNHKAANDHPIHVQEYIEEELKFGALKGQFESNHIPEAHNFPLKPRPKLNAEIRWVIMDLSWPKRASVNDGVDKHGYFGSDFFLTFPTIDHLTAELTKIGRSAHIFKVDISRAFRHFKTDPLIMTFRCRVEWSLALRHETSQL